MQSSTTFDQPADLPAFSFGLDTPSKFLNSTSPNPWSLNSGLTPSLFSSLGARGFTPSFANVAPDVPAGELNPFELSLSAGHTSKRHSISGMDSFADEAMKDPVDADNTFDLFSSTTLPGGRKRAMSTPAIATPGGSSFPFLAQGAAAGPSQPALDPLAHFSLKPAKRPRMDSTGSSIDSSDRIFSDAEKRDTSGSPASSVFTPPDAKVGLPPIEEHAPLLNTDIQVSAPPAAQSLFAQLNQGRSALLASGSGYSQNQPLPMKNLDLAVKPEPVDDAQPLSPVAPRPPVTRGQSKKGKQPEASTSASPSSSRRDSSSAPPSKRKGSGRKKSANSAGGAGGSKPKKEGEVDTNQILEDDDDDTVKRKQFLERNRIAACKSRQKKKEKVGQLEQLAADLCQRNQVLQQTALNLRAEALTLRQLMQAHNGCGCDHAQGYLARDAAGGGIAVIDHLAGRTLTLDYSVPPAMGTEEDVYSFLDRQEPGPPPISQLSSLPGAAAPAAPAIPLASAIPLAGPPPASPSKTRSRQPSEPAGRPTLGMSTRSSVAAAAARPMGFLNVGEGAAAFDPAAQGMLGAHGADIAVQLRSTSAPPTTPGTWEAPQPRGDYFAPKSVVAVA
ncbi:hypothetical protein JCM10207_002790 [Rhodosporidiobolus poonsookiae]